MIRIPRTAFKLKPPVRIEPGFCRFVAQFLPLRALRSSLTVKGKMFGFLKNLLPHKAAAFKVADQEASAPEPPAPAPVPRVSTLRSNLAHPAPNAPNRPNGKGVELPLQAILAGLPLELQPRVLHNTDAGSYTVSVPLEKILAQLASGIVRITFGELRHAAPGVFAPQADRDTVLVPLPLAEILARLNPALITRRRVQRKVEVPAEISSPFDAGGQGLVFSVGPSQPTPAASGPLARQLTPAAPATPAPARGAITSVPAATPPAASTPPAPRAITMPSAPPVWSKAPPASVPSPLTFKPPIAPQHPPANLQPPAKLTPPASIQPPPASNHQPIRVQPPIKVQLPAPAPAPAPSSARPAPISPAFRMVPSLNDSAAPVDAPAPAQPLAPPPSAAPAAPASSASETESLTVGITSLAEGWPDAVRKDIVGLNLVDARVALPVNVVEQALKQGRIAFSWKTLRSWIRPLPLPTVSAHDSLVLELPLKVVAPLFLARQREKTKDQNKISIDDEIPNLFFGFPQTEAPNAAVTSPRASADTNYYVWDDASEMVQEDETTIKRRPSPGTKFVAKYATPNEIVSRAAALDGVAGALIALPDGLMVASRLSSDLNADTLAAFLPQIFGKVSQCTKELRMGDLNNLNFTVGNVPWKIFRVNAIFFAAFGRAGAPLPTAQLAALASELDHKPR